MVLVEIVSQHFGQGLLMAAVNCLATVEEGDQQLLDGMLNKLNGVNSLNNAKTMGLIRLKLSTSNIAGNSVSCIEIF